MVSSNLLKFLTLCLVWGLTWIGVKVGISSVPPTVFAATRFMAAGLILLGYTCVIRGLPAFFIEDAPRLMVGSLLMITLCYGPLFWGMQFVSSGTAAVVEMSLTPLALLGFGILLGQEIWSWRRASAMAVGIAGLYLLFDHPVEETQTDELIGYLAVIFAALSSAYGSVIAGPLISRYGSIFVAGSTTLIGGTILLGCAFLAGEGPVRAFPIFWRWEALAGWAFLIVFGSLVGYSLYLQLLRDAGPARAGSFAFVSPAIAVAVGVLIGGETVSAINLLGMALMLISASVCLYSDQSLRPTAGERQAPPIPVDTLRTACSPSRPPADPQ
ncbi:drug/metabolite transporter (DMT)-like permease [Rhizobium sp. BK650]|uniref:DMT family transporter n=1 Tax=Rhizobium sp. BK650 TaxID=2586990 RepID=UPI001616694F|nr:EamA family transporter [Rhizobium sp. BK650]MBB3659793.1 drug/metabolite transporter (DMT)-like permease [Rhizobium sp. BK650]